MKNYPVAEKYLIFEDDQKALLPAEVVERLIETFDRVWTEICEKYNKGEMKNVTIVADEREGAIGWCGGGSKIGVGVKWITERPWDTDLLTHELVHAAQAYPSYGDEKAPGWVVEGIADYGRDVHGIYNKEGNWALPKYNEKHNYDNSYRITGAFFLWVEKNVCPTFVKEINDAIKDGKYSSEIYEKLTGKTIEALWADYAAASNA